MDLTWAVRHFDALTGRDMHDLLKLRVDVFVVEQRCAYAEVDGRDPDALHVLGRTMQGSLIAYARVLPPSTDTPVRIGRVVVHADHRGKGIAHLLMRKTLEAARHAHGNCRMVLAAQSHLERFYAGHGFARMGADYDWDGIPHVDMERQPEGLSGPR